MSLARRHLGLQGGRSSVSGITATVFGATGFLGRYVVNRLGKTGTRVVVPFRGDEKDVRHLKVMGDLGQIVHLDFSIRDADAIKYAVERSNVVVNMVGREWETRNFSFEDVHVEFPAKLAEICKEVGVERLVHVSALLFGRSEYSLWCRKSKGVSEFRRPAPSSTRRVRPRPARKAAASAASVD